MADTVTVEKSYLDALFRRAELHTAHDSFMPDQPDSVTISKSEYNYLLQAVHEYQTLSIALLRSGISQETLEAFLAGEDHKNPPHVSISTTGTNASFSDRSSQPSTSCTNPRNMKRTLDLSGGYKAYDASRGADHGARGREDSLVPSGSSVQSPRDGDGRFLLDNTHDSHLKPPFPKKDQRTIFISNLSERTMHKDIAKVIRGGRLLEIFLRNDRAATVSFVEGAKEFMDYAKRNDIYLDGKRIEVKWHDRQFQMPHHVADKIKSGATRNILIRNGNGKVSEEEIRTHMEHIHNLVILEIKVQDGDIYVSTNSIHNALFARTCMMSRQKYKGLKVEWYPDECAEPLVVAQRPSSARASIPERSKGQVNLTNRFNVLNMDDDEDSDDEESEDDSEEEGAAQLPYSTFSQGVPITSWADASISA